MYMVNRRLIVAPTNRASHGASRISPRFYEKAKWRPNDIKIVRIDMIHSDTFPFLQHPLQNDVLRRNRDFQPMLAPCLHAHRDTSVILNFKALMIRRYHIIWHHSIIS
jgi:hypothetical protein